MSTDTRTIRAFGWISSMLAASMGAEARAATAISIVTPAGGESWAADTTVAITWDVTEPTDYVDIYLERGGQWYTSIGYAPMAEGQLDW